MFDFKSLGFTEDELKQRVVDQICNQLLTATHYDYSEDTEYSGASTLMRDLEKKVREQIDASISTLAEQHILPNVAQYIENLTLQQTNQWGEKRGEPVSFVEYLVQRAEAYMQEQVDHSGKSKTQDNSYSWSGKQTRITYLIHQHLQYSIETAMKDAMKVATNSIAKGIEATAKQKLAEIAETLKVGVSTK